MINQTRRKTHRLLIRVADDEKGHETDAEGRTVIYTKWKEVNEINLGSVNHPNTEIIEFSLQSIDDRPKNPFRNFFGE